MDFAVFGTEHFKKLVFAPETRGVFDRGFRIFLNGEGILETIGDLKESFSESTRPGIPSEAEFANLVNDFWHHAIWSAKKLLRGGMWAAKSCVNGYMRYMKMIVLKMVEWQRFSFYKLNRFTRFEKVL